ncbi:SDR family oxidoreductase [Flavobacterium defluvii]|uniref:NADP-dependent 3-hydroxy acid dehydrogenase YdfG n=1 Tax=Flavobacterium defluvii TaxID=370979 RepID=A0A1M5UJG9_9FLAO|nr:SDR family oxidoreductase [Flavobacterium defluvii]SHH63048.1 NADP-dependent 3-hydroxy acid dehydrogenase YdfG [Flavobacterium defluvii]
MEKLSNYFGQNIIQKRIVITGGTTGIGKAIAELLVSLGGRVFIFGRDVNDFNEAMDDIKTKASAGEIYGVPADITKKEDVQMIWERIDNMLGGIDILINNAALAAGGIVEGNTDEWRYILDTNIWGYMAFAKEAVTRMKDQKSGHIINIGSMSAETQNKESVIYVATKTAIRGFSTSLRKEINPLGIKVSHIEPGAVTSDMQKDPKEVQEEKIKKMEMLEAEDIAMSVLFCLSQPKRCDIVSMQIRPHLQVI